MFTSMGKFLVVALVLHAASTSLAAPIKFRRPVVAPVEVREQIETPALMERQEPDGAVAAAHRVVRRRLRPDDGDIGRSARNPVIAGREPLKKETVITTSSATINAVSGSGSLGTNGDRVHIDVISTTHKTTIIEDDASSPKPCRRKHHCSKGKGRKWKGWVGKGKKCGGKPPQTQNTQQPSTTSTSPIPTATTSGDPSLPASGTASNTTTNQTFNTTTNQTSPSETQAPAPLLVPDANFDQKNSSSQLILVPEKPISV